MSTNDVPGADPKNQDTLKMGCWAEHEDGSLIFVKSVEGSRVIYELYDTAATPIVQYTDAMPQEGFEKQFSWNPADKKSIRWTWHDKTPFPWDRVIKNGAKDGMTFASAQDQITAAARVAMSLALRGRDVDPETLKHLMSTVSPAGASIRNRLQSVIDELPTDDRVSRQRAQILEDAQKKLEKLEKPKKKSLLQRITGR